MWFISQFNSYVSVTFYLFFFAFHRSKSQQLHSLQFQIQRQAKSFICFFSKLQGAKQSRTSYHKVVFPSFDCCALVNEAAGPWQVTGDMWHVTGERAPTFPGTMLRPAGERPEQHTCARGAHLPSAVRSVSRALKEARWWCSPVDSSWTHSDFPLHRAQWVRTKYPASTSFLSEMVTRRWRHCLNV